MKTVTPNFGEEKVGASRIPDAPGERVPSPPLTTPLVQVLLECPTCGRVKQAKREKHDPPNTSKVVMPCDKCCDEVNDVRYYDSHGKQLDGEGNRL